MCGGIFRLKTKLIWRGFKMTREQKLEDVFKDFRSHWRNRYPPIVTDITDAAIFVLDDWNDSPKSKLTWNKSMRQHTVKQGSEFEK